VIIDRGVKVGDGTMAELSAQAAGAGSSLEQIFLASRPGIVMLSTLASLTFWQAKNRIRVRLARLKQPRYLVGSIAGIAYIGYFAILRNPGFSRGRGARRRRISHAPPATGARRGIITAAARGARLDPACRGSAVRFSPSEVQFLFPAPITRRQLCSIVCSALSSASVRQRHGHAVS
jgi:hypothetical protein